MCSHQLSKGLSETVSEWVNELTCNNMFTTHRCIMIVSHNTWLTDGIRGMS